MSIKKVGLYGGSFNPIHVGHLRAAEEIREILSLDKILFILTSIHPHKDQEYVPSSDIRLEMLKIATENNFEFEISDVELRRKGPSYTIDTLKYFSRNSEDEHYFIMGIENFLKINTWKSYKSLFKYANFIVVFRPGYESNKIDKLIPKELSNIFKYELSDDKKTVFKNKDSKKLFFIKISGIEVSSTQIRNLLKQKKSVRYYVPERLSDFLKTNRIYSEK